MGQKGKVCIGCLLAPHGVHGQTRLASYTSDPAALFSYVPLSDDKGTRSFDIKRQGTAKKGFIVSIEGVNDRNEAEALRGTKLYVDRNVLPEEQEDEYYFADLLGLKVRDQNAEEIGEIQAVHNFGAGDIIEIRPPKGKSFMLPFDDAFVPEINVEAGLVHVFVPEGWLKEEKPE